MKSDWYFSLQLGALLDEFRRRRKVLAIGNGIILLLAILFLILAPAQYEATIVVVPDFEQAQQSPLSSSLSSLLSSNAGTPPSFTNFQQLLTSEDVAARLMKKHPEFLPLIFNHEWDAQTKTWHPPGGLMSSILRGLNEIFGRVGWVPPDPYRLAKYITGQVDIEQLGTTPVYQITFDHPDQAFSAAFIDALQHSADELLKENRRAVLNARINYLNRVAQQSSIITYQQSVVQLLVQMQAELATLGEGFPYAAQVLQKPTVSPYPTSPNIILVLLGAVLVGVLFTGSYLLYVTPFGSRAMTAGVRSPEELPDAVKSW